jgi:cytochrome c-type biogenesis protein CcmE
MSKLQIVIVVLAAVVLSIIVATFAQSTESASFGEAASNGGKKVKIVGQLDKNVAIQYDAAVDANLTIFNVIDKDGKSQTVYLHQDSGRPLGLERSENVTLEGKMMPDGNFHSDHLQMKCPSKYNEQDHKTS